MLVVVSYLFLKMLFFDPVHEYVVCLLLRRLLRRRGWLISCLGFDLLVLQVVAFVAARAELGFWLKMLLVLVCIRHIWFANVALPRIFCYCTSRCDCCV